MKFFLRINKIVANNKICCFFIYYYYCFRNKYIDYFDYIKISKNFPIFSISSQPGIIGNKCYGNVRAVKNKLKNTFDKKCMIEHGLYFGERVIEEECTMKNIITIYTYGQYRSKAIRNHIKKLDKKIVTVGPYILYADNFHNPNKLFQIKKKYGRILLAFLSHPFPDITISYDENLFLTEIERIASDFDTVFISLHWIDIRNTMYKKYESKGYKVVCSGTRSDPYFLNRLKDLIELSDMTMSNDLGTHIGYCIALNKPHYLYKQFIYSQGHSCENSDSFHKKRVEEKEIFYKLFGEYKEEITDEQRNIIEYYWGR